MISNWKILQTLLPADSDEMIEWLLINRGITNHAEFLKPQDPTKLTPAEVGIDPANLEKALTRIKQAIINQERVVIFGDYDVDGISATAIAWEAIKEAGLVTKPFIPHRIKHGYGLSLKALRDILGPDDNQTKPDLIITVDNGIVAYEALTYLASLKIDVIVTDHHQPDSKPLTALTTVHTTQICGAGVAWFLAKSLVPDLAKQWLDLVTIATIADQMPLLGINRDFVVAGLEQFKHKIERPGLKALVAVAGIDQKDITAEQLSFGLIPRINAMGRVADGVDSLRLVCVRSEDRAQSLAATLQSTNLARQELTFDLLKEAQAQAELQIDQTIIVVASPNFHEGVIGLLAGKLLEKFHKPVVAIQVSPAVAKASVRSLPGVNIIDFLRSNRELFWELGGHELAAGFACDPAKVVEIQKKLIASAKEKIRPSQLSAEILVDCVLPIELLKLATFDELVKLQPYGQANPKPLFLLTKATASKFDIIGKNHQHLRLKLDLADGREITALAWSKADWANKILIGQSVDLLAHLDVNVWKNHRQLQLILVDWRPAA